MRTGSGGAGVDIKCPKSTSSILLALCEKTECNSLEKKIYSPADCVFMAPQDHSKRALSRFFLSYTIHLTSIIFFPLLVGFLLLGVGYYFTTKYLIAAALLDLFGEDPVVEYVLAFVFAIVTFLFGVFLFSSVLGAYIYAKNMFSPLMRKFFSEQEFTPARASSYPPKPTAPPPQSTAASPLTNAYAESSDRARWGPR